MNIQYREREREYIDLVCNTWYRIFVFLLTILIDHCHVLSNLVVYGKLQRGFGPRTRSAGDGSNGDGTMEPWQRLKHLLIQSGSNQKTFCNDGCCGKLSKNIKTLQSNLSVNLLYWLAQGSICWMKRPTLHRNGVHLRASVPIKAGCGDCFVLYKNCASQCKSRRYNKDPWVVKSLWTRHSWCSEKVLGRRSKPWLWEAIHLVSPGWWEMIA